ncbi:MAG: hypothetical protein FWH27_17110, partial [Planctomycetaceae bacterium]|nr:hypothetical protein [Planctomycetaceae bacterium]
MTEDTFFEQKLAAHRPKLLREIEIVSKTAAGNEVSAANGVTGSGWQPPFPVTPFGHLVTSLRS